MNDVSLNILSPYTLKSPDHGRAILELLCHSAPSIAPVKCGDSEPLKQPFDCANMTNIAALWDRYFCWKSKRPGSHGGVAIPYGPRPIHSRIHLQERPKGLDIDGILRFFKKCSVLVDADFGSVHILTKNDHRSEVARGTAYPIPNSIHGVNSFVLQKHLPNLYWGTILGPAYVKLFTRERLLSAPAYLVEELAPEMIYLQLSENITDLQTEYDKVNAAREGIKQYLNQSVFFRDEDGPGAVYNVPKFSLEMAAPTVPIAGQQDNNGTSGTLHTAIDDLVAHTRDIVDQFGIEDLIPTATFLRSDRMMAFPDVPDDMHRDTAILDVVKAQAAEDEEVLIACKHDANHFKIIHWKGVLMGEEVYPVKV